MSLQDRILAERRKRAQEQIKKERLDEPFVAAMRLLGAALEEVVASQAALWADELAELAKLEVTTKGWTVWMGLNEKFYILADGHFPGNDEDSRGILVYCSGRPGGERKWKISLSKAESGVHFVCEESGQIAVELLAEWMVEDLTLRVPLSLPELESCREAA